MKAFTIAMDGPVAAGKGTIGCALAEKVNGVYIYTGGMYRALALIADKEGVNVDNENELLDLLLKTEINPLNGTVLLNGEDVTERIKMQDVAYGASRVSIFPSVRAEMVKRQQQMAEKFIGEGKIVIGEGRDAGTVIFPDSPFKIFLTATPEVRAQRRLDQFKELGRDESFETVLQEVKKRDAADSEREADPLVSDPEKHGYFVLDDSNQTEEKTAEIIISEMRKRGLYDSN